MKTIGKKTNGKTRAARQLWTNTECVYCGGTGKSFYCAECDSFSVSNCEHLTSGWPPVPRFYCDNCGVETTNVTDHNCGGKK